MRRSGRLDGSGARRMDPAVRDYTHPRPACNMREVRLVVEVLERRTYNLGTRCGIQRAELARLSVPVNSREHPRASSLIVT